MDFVGRTAIVTGGAKGIGRGCCELLAKNGADVMVADMNIEGAEAVAKALVSEGFSAQAVQVNVKSVSDVQSMVKQTAAAFGGVDILINNAGILHTTPIEDITEEEWDNIVDINLKSVFFATQAVLPYMKEKH
ncbi:MAG: SDR family NAD(P)-dependent oxidoreductase, partial [Christensenella sp.]